MPGPLANLKILDLTRLLPGGYATLMLADLGADVVKVEEPGKGDYMRWIPPMSGSVSASHLALNRNKRSITLDLKKSDGVEVFVELARHFDVVIESFRPGVMDRLGVGWDVLRSRYPRLVYCAITGYGQDGPRSQVAGHDANYIGYAGALSINGELGRRPVIPGLQIGDLAGGGMAAVISIVVALRRRDETGEGSFCDVSMMDGVLSLLSIHAGQFNVTREPPERELMPLSGAYPCYRVYPAADGWLAVGALEYQFWSELCDALGRPDLADDGFAVGDRATQVIAELATIFAAKTRSEWMEQLDGRDVCVGPVNDFGEAFADEQARHREMIVHQEIPGHGAWTHVGNPIKLSGAQDVLVRRQAPEIGEHTEEVLEEAGIDPDRRARLRADGVV